MRNSMRIVWRGIVMVFCVLILILMIPFVVGELQDYFDAKDRAENISGYDWYLYNGYYMSLRDKLASGLPEGEQYQIYWDVADAYEAWSVCDFWHRAAQGGALDEESEGLEAEYLADLRGIYARSDATARKIILSFAEDYLD